MASRGDVLADAAALLAATAARDGEAQKIILDYSDNRAVATVLAGVVTAMCRSCDASLLGALCDELRTISQEDTTP
jgi:hypothetical protein